jgi:hypothetical protein
MFYGLVIRMFYNDHAPPHVYVQDGEFQAEMAIETLQILAGRLPRRALGMTLEWAASHRAELFDDWDLCRQHKQPTQIPPLEEVSYALRCHSGKAIGTFMSGRGFRWFEGRG